jgi:hypothetical protein
VPVLNGRKLHWFQGRFSAAQEASTACFICAATRSNTTSGRSLGAMGGPSIKCCPTSRKPKPIHEVPVNGMGTAAR